MSNKKRDKTFTDNKMITIPEQELIYSNRDYWEYKQNYNTVSFLLSNKGRLQVLDFIEKNNYNKIIIYGAGVFGKLLFDVLKKVLNEQYDVDVVDQTGGSIFDFGEYEINRAENFEFLGHDVCIVTPITAFEPISAFINEKGFKNCISLYDMLFFGEQKEVFL